MVPVHMNLCICIYTHGICHTHIYIYMHTCLVIQLFVCVYTYRDGNMIYVHRYVHRNLCVHLYIAVARKETNGSCTELQSRLLVNGASAEPNLVDESKMGASRLAKLGSYPAPPQLPCKTFDRPSDRPATTL